MAGGDMVAGTQNGMATDATAVLPKSDVMDTPPPAEHVEALYRDLDALKILDLPPDERFQKIIAMTPKQMQAFRQSLDGGEQAELAQGLSPQQREVLAALQGSSVANVTQIDVAGMPVETELTELAGMPNTVPKGSTWI